MLSYLKNIILFFILSRKMFFPLLLHISSKSDFFFIAFPSLHKGCKAVYNKNIYNEM